MYPRDAAALYRRNAHHCVEIAHDIADPGRKATLLDMAQYWLILANQADRNGEVSLVYETPDPDRRAAEQQAQPEKSNPG